jgi:hypothetical protein
MWFFLINNVRLFPTQLTQDNSKNRKNILQFINFNVALMEIETFPRIYFPPRGKRYLEFEIDDQNVSLFSQNNFPMKPTKGFCTNIGYYSKKRNEVNNI